MKNWRNYSSFLIPHSSLRGGFTLIELLVAGAILALVTGLGLAAFRSFEERQKLIQEAQNFKLSLRSVQIAAQTGTQPIDGCRSLGSEVEMSAIRVLFNSSSSFKAEIVCLDKSTIPNREYTILIKEEYYKIATLGVSYTYTQSPIEFKTLSRGVSTPTNISLQNGGGKSYLLVVTNSGEIRDVGILTGDLATPGVGQTITIRAKGTMAGGSYPNMQLIIAGLLVRSWTVSGDLALYTYNQASQINITDIAVAFTNDYYLPPEDRNLFVDWVDLDGVPFQTEAANVCSTGTWKQGTGCDPGFKQSEWLHCSGEFRYAQSSCS